MLAIIPARGGSKGLPGKNLRPLLGKPLIAHTIEAAQKSKFVTDIVISTEDQEIADTAVKYGARLPFMRPEYLATDTSLAIKTYQYTIDRLSNDENRKIDEFIVLQPTSPLRTHVDIDSAIQLFQEKKADSVISFVAEGHPLFWHKYIRADLTFENIFEETIANRQEYKPSYFPNGAIYVYKSALLKQDKMYSEKSFAYIMPSQSSVDIDTLLDFEIAELLLSKRGH